MSRNAKSMSRLDLAVVEVKSKYNAEFRRFSVNRSGTPSYGEFEKLLVELHQLQGTPVVICYTDPEGDLLPINNDDNYNRALAIAKPILRILLQRKGESYGEVLGYGTLQKKKGGAASMTKMVVPELKMMPRAKISLPQDFRRVSAIIDVDCIPETHRRVRLMKNGSDKPLGFYIRDGTSIRVSSQGLEKVPGVFISRLVPGGLAESTGLLAVNDEVLEVNGIEVTGKTLDQVTDMMVANSANLIITVKPVNQRNNISPKHGTISRVSQKSTGSFQSSQSGVSYDSDEVKDHIQEEDEDQVRDHLAETESGPAQTSTAAKTATPSGTPQSTRKAEEVSSNHTESTSAQSNAALPTTGATDTLSNTDAVTL